MGGIAREIRQETREEQEEEQEEEGWYLLLVVLCDSIVQSLEAPVILHLWVRLALCKQLHQAEAAITCCQHQGSPVHKCNTDTCTHSSTVIGCGGHLPSLAICGIDISSIIDKGGSHTVVAFQCRQVQSCTAILVGGRGRQRGKDRFITFGST